MGNQSNKECFFYRVPEYDGFAAWKPASSGTFVTAAALEKTIRDTA
jgi:hypothetical protein